MSNAQITEQLHGLAKHVISLRPIEVNALMEAAETLRQIDEAEMAYDAWCTQQEQRNLWEASERNTTPEQIERPN